ncbi:diacylglycerol O-acyltransferase 1 [Allomyces arbusculus]|nr:diacylglycerol O-acyltransferase 1 [Allomyces arbusculus]
MQIKFAPLSVPIARRRQTIGAMTWVILVPLSLTIYALLLWWSYTRALALAYMTWILFWDTAPETGGRRSSFVRRLVVWRWMRDFFPVSLRKLADLDPDRNYVFGYHPHGIISLGAWVNFGTEATGFSSLFPGINLRLLTLSQNFSLPIFREILLWLSITSVSKKSVEAILNKGPGHSACIVVGGAQESLYAHPGELNLVLKKRLGFVKIAIQNGASLVPILSFGENEVYDVHPTKKGTTIYAGQQLIKNTFGWTIPVFLGRGVFNYSLGILPHRRPITSVVGVPVHPEEVVGHPINPKTLTNEELMEITRRVHDVYMQRLVEIWDQFKDELAPNRVKELTFVE